MLKHLSIHFSPCCVPFRGARLFDRAKLYFHITVEVHYSGEPQTRYIKKEGGVGGGEKKTHKATLVIFYLDASSSNVGFDKVTASKCSIYLKAVWFI